MASSSITQKFALRMSKASRRADPAASLNTFIADTAAERVDRSLLERFERVTGRRPHRYLRRGIVFSHRDLDLLLDKYEQGQPIYLFTGRGPSSDSLHIGHSIPFEFTKWLQDAFQAKLIIMLTDDMKLLHSTKLQVDDVRRFTTDNAKDILAFGFHQPQTFMFSNLDFVGGAFYQNIIQVARRIPVRNIKTALGFTDTHNVGMFYCCSTQSAGCFGTSFPGILSNDPDELKDMSCLIACSYDIDGYFSEVRKHAPLLGSTPPAFLYSSLLPSLQGTDAKMSASVQASAIFLTDDPATIREKLEAAFPAETMNVDLALQWLRFFMEDDANLRSLETMIRATTLSHVGLREVLVQIVQERVQRFQRDRAGVTDDLLAGFMERRLLR